MTVRANWKGYLKVAEVTCAVGLYSATSSSDRIAFHMINRKTGHRLQRQFADSVTGSPVEREDQVKGYEVGDDDYVVLSPDEIAAVLPESDKVLDVSAFVRCDDIDDIYFDRPYYLAPTDETARESFALIRDGMETKSVAAIASTVLFRRVRTVLIRPYGSGLIATTLNFDYEVRPVAEAFRDMPTLKIKGEMRDLASHIIKSKAGTFDPATFDDRYETALAELVKAKAEGRKIKRPKAKAQDKAVDLLAALRESAGVDKTVSTPKSRRKPAA